MTMVMARIVMMMLMMATMQDDDDDGKDDDNEDGDEVEGKGERQLLAGINQD